ncbi:MAG: glycosyltransferase family 2 protein [archaeon]|nr:glycosyltransferase family 2 protein [archaeon]MCP8313923.1 glycosyltransferase family 2 protein [archaeon]
MKDRPKLSVIMPAYNEEKHIEGAIEAAVKVLEEIGLNYEIIAVNDGSSDRTAKKVLECAKKHNAVNLVSYNENRGKGYAIKEGFKHTSGEVLFLLDTGGEISPVNLQEYLSALKYVDVAIGSKWHRQSSIQAPFLRKFLSKCFYVLAKLLVGIKVSDTQAGFKAFKREALEKLVKMQSAKRYVFDVEFLALANLLKLKLVELPIHIRLDAGFSLRKIWQMFWELLGVAYRLRIKKWYQKTFFKCTN